MLNITKKEMILINELIQVETANKQDKIIRYVIEANKDEKALLVEAFQPNGKFAVFLRKKIPDLDESFNIPIENSVEFGEILSKVIDTNEITIKIEKNKVILENKKDTIELPFFEESKTEIERKKTLQGFFETKKYGNATNMLTLYERENKDDPNPDAKCKLDLKKLNIKNITSIFNKGAVEISAKDEKFFLTIGGGKRKKSKNITRIIEKEEDKEEFKIDGECSILLQDINCISMLSKSDGITYIDMKKEFPMVLKKKFPDENIGVCYSVSLLEESE